MIALDLRPWLALLCPALLVAVPSAQPPADAALGFVANRGQWPAEVRLRLCRGGATLWLHDDGATLALLRYRASPAGEDPPPSARPARAADRGVALRLTFEGADAAPALCGAAPLAATHSFFVGRNRARWVAAAPSYARAVQAELYPGVELHWLLRGGQPSYDLYAAPGADLARVIVRVDGGDGLAVDARGGLAVQTAVGALALSPPRSFELTAAGPRPVPSRFALVDATRYRVEVDRVDDAAPLLIDPGIEWASFAGGAGFDDPLNTRTDAAGRLYFTGYVESHPFPTTPGAFQPALPGGVRDVVVGCAEPGAAGRLVWATHLGGAADDVGYDMHVPPAGAPVTVVGRTSSGDFPTTEGALQPMKRTLHDAFFAQLGADGTTLDYATFLGGEGSDRACALRRDSGGVYTVAGYTSSRTFPVTAGALRTELAGGFDAFVAKLAPGRAGAAQLVAGTYVGGSGAEGTWSPTALPISADNLDVAVDAAGTVTLAGATASHDFPVTAGAFQPAYAGGARDVFVARLDAALGALLYATHLGSEADDAPMRLEADRDGDLVVTGFTTGESFPTTPGAYQRTLGGLGDGVVAVLRPAGLGPADLRYATRLGGPGSDLVGSAAIESSGVLVLAGTTGGGIPSPTPGAAQTRFAGYSMGFFARLDPAGGGASDLHYLTYVGAGGIKKTNLYEGVFDLVQLDDGRILAAGWTDNPAFPITEGAFQPTYGGGIIDVALVQADLLPGNVTRLGASTPACLGALDLQLDRMPAPGQTVTLLCNDAPPGAPGVLLAGTVLESPLTIVGASVFVLPALALPVTAQAGFARLPLPIPATLPTPRPLLALQLAFATTAACPGTAPLAASDALAF